MNTCLRAGGGGLLVGGLGTYFVSAHGIKLGVSKGPIDRTLVGLEGGETYVAALVQECVMCNGK